ncbi:MAG: DUF3127 domain-containing protein [Cyclobacteriaceae bacterium]
MSMELKGRVVQLLPMQSGMGKKGQWKKQEFIVETVGQYPKKVCLSLWGNKVDQFGVKEGDDIAAMIDIESREYNGRWYTDVRAWKIEKGGMGGSNPTAPPPPMEEPQDFGSSDDLPF